MRNKSLDLLKWFAIAMMVIDHLRLIQFFSSYNNLLVTIGRFAFPTFCFILAVNFKRISKNKNTTAIKSYLVNLGVFSLISELPYRMLEKDPVTINVMPTLLLGLIFMVLADFQHKHKAGLIILFVLFLTYTNQWLMYGAVGVFLPYACLIALRYQDKKILVLLTMAIAALCNAQYLISGIRAFPVLVLSISSFAALAILLCFFLIRKNLSWSVAPVGHWGYWFYPVHLFIFSLFNIFL